MSRRGTVNSVPYKQALEIQNALVKRVLNYANVADHDAAVCAREWVNIERLKREMRGIPPLALHRLTELMPKQARRAIAAPSIIDVPTVDGREPTMTRPVPTPPPPKPPAGAGDDNDTHSHNGHASPATTATGATGIIRR